MTHTLNDTDIELYYRHDTFIDGKLKVNVNVVYEGEQTTLTFFVEDFEVIQDILDVQINDEPEIIVQQTFHKHLFVYFESEIISWLSKYIEV